MIPTHLSCHPYPNINEAPTPLPTTPPPPPTPIICNNSTMIMASLAQMRESNGCGSVRNDDIFNLHLGFVVHP